MMPSSKGLARHVTEQCRHLNAACNVLFCFEQSRAAGGCAQTCTSAECCETHINFCSAVVRKVRVTIFYAEKSEFTRIIAK